MDRDFEFIAGALSLNLVDTVSNWAGSPVERLNDPADLSGWLHAAGLAEAGVAPALADLETTRSLRAAIHRCGRAAIAGDPMKPADLRIINRAAAAAPLRPRLANGTVQLTADNPVEAALSTIAADAIAILADTSHPRLRICPGCQMMFFDSSRPGKRRWCSSAAGCGNRAKVGRHRRREQQRQRKLSRKRA